MKDEFVEAQGTYDATQQAAFRTLQELIILRKRWAGQISEQRYGDMAYRTFQLDALQKYRRQFDLAQSYVFLTAAAYDYDTNLALDDSQTGAKFLRDIVALRTLGQLQDDPGVGIQPIAGSGGLAEPLAQMRDNFVVLKGQMGFNKPQPEEKVFSLRHELFRLRAGTNARWKQELSRYYTANIYSNENVARLAKRPFGVTGAQPGLVIPFDTRVVEGLNFFGKPLGPGDNTYNATQFATKVRGVGVFFKDYDGEDRLSNSPQVYLLPAGKDVIRPRDTVGRLRYWNISEQLLPVPYPIGQASLL